MKYRQTPTENLRAKRVWRVGLIGEDGQYATIRCSTCESDVDHSSARRCKIGSRLAWYCRDCAIKARANEVHGNVVYKDVELAPFPHYNTAVQRKAAAKLQDYLDYCEMSNVVPDQDTVYRITASHKIRRTYGLIKTVEVQQSSAGWSHTGQQWPAWGNPIANAITAIELLDHKKTRGKQSLSPWKPLDYYVGLGDVIDAALRDARRISWTAAPAHREVCSRHVPVSPAVWYAPSYLAIATPIPDTNPDWLYGVIAALPDTIDSALASARHIGRNPYYKVTFGESTRSPRSNAVYIERPIGTKLDPVAPHKCKHGLTPSTCVWCARH